MAHDAVHDLTPAYALDALDETERAEYEQHLATCERCRAELASLQEAAGSLAYATVAPAPPPELRERILEQASSERNVVPLRPRRAPVALGAIAAVAATLAIAFGVWNSALLAERDELRALLDPDARVVELPERSGVIDGRLVIDHDGDATLVVDSNPTPEGMDYEVWVIRDGEPNPAGVFDGGSRIVRLTRPVPRGASVAVTLERDGGVNKPTREPFFVVDA